MDAIPKAMESRRREDMVDPSIVLQGRETATLRRKRGPVAGNEEPRGSRSGPAGLPELADPTRPTAIFEKTGSLMIFDVVNVSRGFFSESWN